MVRVGPPIVAESRLFQPALVAFRQAALKGRLPPKLAAHSWPTKIKKTGLIIA
jgi:hypothetical protein